MKRFIFSILLTFTIAFSQDSLQNFALGSLASGISSTDVSMTLYSGQGARFPDTVSYNVIIWDYSSYGWNIAGAYLNSKAEIVRVTANASNVMTITRAQEGTTARAFNTSGHSYYVTMAVTAKTISDIRDSLSVFRTATNNFLDTNAVFRTAINTIKDSVDIPIVCLMPSSYSPQTINYVGLGGSTGFSTTEAGAIATPFGMSGRIHTMLFQSRTNTTSDTLHVTLMYGDTSSAAMTLSNVVLPILPNNKFASITTKELDVSASQVGILKFYVSDGSGSFTLMAVTLIIRVPLN